jgi:hypothetical protein
MTQKKISNVLWISPTSSGQHRTDALHEPPIALQRGRRGDATSDRYLGPQGPKIFGTSWRLNHGEKVMFLEDFTAWRENTTWGYGLAKDQPLNKGLTGFINMYKLSISIYHTKEAPDYGAG